MTMRLGKSIDDVTVMLSRNLIALEPGNRTAHPLIARRFSGREVSLILRYYRNHLDFYGHA